MKLTRTKWFLPLFCVALGAAVFAAQWIGGDARSGLISFAALAVFGLLILFGGGARRCADCVVTHATSASARWTFTRRWWRASL